ncbi:MAG: hypothetical protein M3N43_06910 [Actinomycetota bacterium]|nr:hypothetical protein [Actinomycetota bacterium]
MKIKLLEQATAAEPGTCPCGTPVLEFDIHAGFHVRLEDHDLPITVDITAADVRHRLWQHLGPRLGWAPQFSATRSWRPLRIQHECAAQENKSQNKENTA